MRRLFAAVVICLVGACSDDAGPVAPPLDGGAAVDADASGRDDGGTTAEAGPDGGALDPCATKIAACPITTAASGGGVVAIDRCAFPIDESTSWMALPPLAKALAGIVPTATVEDVIGSLNRTGVPVAAAAVPGGPAGVSLAMKWADDDETNTSWIPQGITGSADARPTGLINGRRILLVSWYWTPPDGTTYRKGVRVAFVDVTDPSAPTYRFALLVEPSGTVAAPNFLPVDLHAGGLVWVGNYLYVVATTGGFRVFDMANIMVGVTDVDQIGCEGTVCRSGLYKYFIPEIGGYNQKSSCGMIFSSASLDRSTDPPAIVSSEYCSTTACAGTLAGRAYRWPLDPTTNKLGAGRMWPSEAVLLGQQQVQGTATRNGLYYMSSSAPVAGGGALYRARTGKSVTSTWLDGPEDLMVDESNQVLWTLSETAGTRVVAGMRLTSYPAP